MITLASRISTRSCRALLRARSWRISIAPRGATTFTNSLSVRHDRRSTCTP